MVHARDEVNTLTELQPCILNGQKVEDFYVAEDHLMQDLAGHSFSRILSKAIWRWREQDLS